MCSVQKINPGSQPWADEWKWPKADRNRKLRKGFLRRLFSSQILLILSNRFKRLKSPPLCAEGRNLFLVWGKWRCTKILEGEDNIIFSFLDVYISLPGHMWIPHVERGKTLLPAGCLLEIRKGSDSLTQLAGDPSPWRSTGKWKVWAKFCSVPGHISPRAENDIALPRLLKGDNVTSRMRSLGHNLILNLIFLACVSITGRRGEGWAWFEQNHPLNLAHSHVAFCSDAIRSQQLRRSGWGLAIKLSVACTTVRCKLKPYTPGQVCAALWALRKRTLTRQWP